MKHFIFSFLLYNLVLVERKKNSNFAFKYKSKVFYFFNCIPARQDETLHRKIFQLN